MRSLTRATLALLIILPVLFGSVQLSGYLSARGDIIIQHIDDYEKAWKRADDAISDGLPKTALKIVEQIYGKARDENNGMQLIKAISYRIALRAQTTDDGETVLFADLEEEVRRAVQPSKSILQSMLATMYWQYYQSNRWAISQRTQVNESAGEDFRTWDARMFFDTTRTLYLQSIAERKLLSAEAIRDYKYILHTENQSELYRRSLYDLLAHRALQFFVSDESDLPKPQQEFEVTGLEALLPAGQFVSKQFSSPDETDQKYNALLLYQDLLRVQLESGSASAIIDLDLQRLAFAREITFNERKDTTYFRSVTRLRERYADSAISTQAGFMVASYYFGIGNYVKALDRCHAEVKRFPESRGAVNCKALISRILHKELNLSIERAVHPDKPILLSTQYRNLEKVYCRLIKLEREFIDEYNYGWRNRKVEDWLADMIARNPVHEWSQNLPETDDYKSHRVEIKAPELPLGQWMLLMSADENFSIEGNAIAYSHLVTTRLSLQSQDEQDGSISFWVLDAQTGSPLNSVRVDMYSRKWNSGMYRWDRNHVRTVRTDRKGGFRLQVGEQREGVMFKLSKGPDEHYISREFYPYDRGQSRQHTRSLIFTDRAIYRPGQTVYFKGIVFREERQKADYGVVKNSPVSVTFYDANHQKIQSLQLRSNDFGSYHGTFIVPEGVLTGVMTIRDGWGTAQIRAEEYKRPKFEVEFNPVEGTFKLDELITARGNAKAYAGSNIDGASVTWRVTRRARYPYWYWWWRPMPGSGEKEIAHGESGTDAAGGFAIDFIAAPDRTVDRKQLPVFTYTVHADVTDINGETHSGSTSISVGYTSVTLSINVPEKADRRAVPPVVLRAANLNGQPVSADGTIVIEKMKVPTRLLRRSFFQRPDQFAMTQKEFYRDFPEDLYKDENNPEHWQVEQKILDKRFHIDADGSDSLDTREYRTGYYRITLEARDPGGEKLLVKRYFTVYDRKSKSLPYASTSILLPVKTTCEPGEKAEVIFGSSYKPAHVLMRLEHRGAVIREEWVKLSAAQRSFSVPIEEKHRGGLTMHLFFVHSYRTYSERIFIAVPWSNKQLTIETATFRDKLRPGQQEQWRLTIKGEKADQVAAEMVAGMYDASLDAIYQQSWPSFAWPTFSNWSQISGQSFGVASARLHQRGWNQSPGHWHQQYDRLNMFLLDVGYGHYYGRRQIVMKSALMSMDMNAPMSAVAADGLGKVAEEGEMLDEAKKERRKDKNDADDSMAQDPGAAVSVEGLDNLKVRSNFNETAFFFPQLMTNDSGEVVLSFTVPEALTRWKLRTFAHTPDLDVGYLEKTTVTQKELMVMPGVPRFLREGDRIVLSTKITNLSDSALSGVAALKLFDAVTMKPLDSLFGLENPQKAFTAEQGRSTVVRWELTVPEGLSAIVYRFVARAGAFSDGEEAPLPVLPNRMLVTESLPLNVRGNTERSYSFTRLANAGNSSTLRHHRLTLEMTSNPAWYAIQALPYLMEYPYECSEQVFNRLYANSIAAHIVNSSPKIKRVFEQWKGTDALLSNLEKNQELKSLLLEETPWVMQAQNETQRKQRVGLLFDLNNMANSLDRAIRKLEKSQSGNGGWPWFPGMPESRYITQYIVAGFGHLRELGVRDPDERITRMLQRAVRFIDERMAHDYEELKRREDPLDPEKDYLRHIDLQYLYARSYFLKQEIPGQYSEAVDFWLDQSRRFWLRRNLMSQGMIALSAYRFGQSAYKYDSKKLPGKIVASLRERALTSDELGMYWKQDRGWYWYQAPIQTQALLIEAFDVIDGDMNSVEEMKIWLLKQKQVQDWKTTIATAEACYALLRRGSDLLASDEMVEVRMGGDVIDPAAMGADIEAGTGHYKVAWSGSEIRSDMADITLTKKDKGIAWGAVYWQYFETLENITAHDTPLSIEKKLYRQVNTEKGVTLEPITEKNPLKVGDILKVRITIRVDRNMEYVHMKDMRGAGLELINQLSLYRWQGGLGYYEAPKDASVNFFFYWLRKGVHVFEYGLRVAHEGRFSNGISTIQSMYAPEFAAHTAGVTVVVK